mmetsp:Transcript_36356/g.102438  ORF Transcript_36356/g.102438 Transcript_36356/m.102438 type:complete len:244 (-) Transcript_36356:562-1293(-)
MLFGSRLRQPEGARRHGCDGGPAGRCRPSGRGGPVRTGGAATHQLGRPWGLWAPGAGAAAVLRRAGGAGGRTGAPCRGRQEPQPRRAQRESPLVGRHACVRGPAVRLHGSGSHRASQCHDRLGARATPGGSGSSGGVGCVHVAEAQGRRSCYGSSPGPAGCVHGGPVGGWHRLGRQVAGGVGRHQACVGIQVQRAGLVELSTRRIGPRRRVHGCALPGSCGRKVCLCGAHRPSHHEGRGPSLC